MRALISADMEGATGVTGAEDCIPGKDGYSRFRHLFTADVNAVAIGFLEAGVNEVVVTEAHGGMRHVLLEDLDERVIMISGRNHDFAMLEGIQQKPDLVAFVGYHAAAGTAGILSHTFAGAQIHRVTLNDRIMSEGYLNALLCAENGARLALVSGDDVTCEDAIGYAPGVAAVAVKTAVDRYTGRCLSPSATGAMLRVAAEQSVTSARVPPLPPAPYTCVIDFTFSNFALSAALVPGVVRTGERSVSFSLDTVAELYRCFHVVVTMAQAASETLYG